MVSGNFKLQQCRILQESCRNRCQSSALGTPHLLVTAVTAGYGIHNTRYCIHNTTVVVYNTTNYSILYCRIVISQSRLKRELSCENTEIIINYQKKSSGAAANHNPTLNGPTVHAVCTSQRCVCSVQKFTILILEVRIALRRRVSPTLECMSINAINHSHVSLSAGLRLSAVSVSLDLPIPCRSHRP